MSEILLHDLQQRAEILAARLSAALLQSDEPQISALASRLDVQAGPKPRLVLTGQYNSGKSTLVKALTNGAAEVVIDSAPATDTVAEYDWDGLVSLIDTPGVKTGINLHDQRAEGAITAADLILFVITVDLFDDTGAQHLRHVLIDLSKAEQVIVVVNKNLSIDPPPAGVRAQAVMDAARISTPPPFVECDAREYLDGLDTSDADERGEMLDASQVDSLRDAINRLARTTGRLAQFRAPLQLIRAVVDEATALQADGLDAQAALLVLGRERAALTQRTGRIEAALNRLRTAFLRDSQALAERFADAVEELDDQPELVRESRLTALQEDLEASLEARYEQLRLSATQVVEQQLNDLASEALEIEQGPGAQRLIRVTNDHRELRTEGVMPTAPNPRAAAGQDPGQGWSAREWLDRAGDANRRFAQLWGAGSGVKAAAGSQGHKIVLDVGHKLGKSFKPWEAVRLANNIGRVLKVVGPAIQIAQAAVEVAAQERAQIAAERHRHQRRQALVAEVQRQPDEITTELRRQVAEAIKPPFTASIAEIDEVVAGLHAEIAERSSWASELAAIRADADSALALT